MRQCSKDVKVEFSISKYKVVSRQRGKKVGWEGIKLPNGEDIYEPIAPVTNVEVY